MEDYPSKLLSNAIEQFSSLPGIGKRTAMRLALHLLKQEKEEVNKFGEAFIRLRNDILYCEKCYNISEEVVCGICQHLGRDASIICVVEDVRDVMAIEELVARVQNESVSEVIMALSTTMEGDTTNFYIFKRLKDFGVNISAIARGVAIGDELEYADELTLGRSLINRVPYENTLAR